MASSVSLVIKTDADVSSLVGSSTTPKESVNRLIDLLSAGLGGAKNLSVDATAVSGTAPAAASGTITLTYGSIVAGTDTLTIGGVTLSSSSSTTDGTHWKVVTDGPTTATNIATCINTNTTLGKVLTATASASVVTVTAKEKGALGNLVGLVSSNGTGAAVSAATLAGGAGGFSGAVSTYRMGL